MKYFCYYEPPATHTIPRYFAGSSMLINASILFILFIYKLKFVGLDFSVTLHCLKKCFHLFLQVLKDVIKAARLS